MVIIDLSNLIVNEIHHVLFVRLEKNEKHSFNRSCLGLLFAESGTSHYLMKGRNFILDKDHMLLVPPNSDYSLISIDNSYNFVINITTVQHLELDSIVSYNVSYKNIANIINMLNETWSFKRNSYRLKSMSYIYEILAYINKVKLNDYFPSVKYDKIRPAIHYLEQHYNDPNLTNEQLSEIAGISTVYFRKLFTQKHGISPMKYVKIKRIEKAKEILDSRYYSSIASLAESVGYNSIDNFYKMFKRVTDCTPSEYVKLCAKRNKSIN